jgi:hypothetical protein
MATETHHANEGDAMTAAANVAHLRSVWRELAAQAAIDGDWTAADAAGNAYDTARTLHESESETP